MPAPVIDSLAKKYKVQKSTVEKYWNESKKAIDGNPDDEDFPWGVVTNMTKDKLKDHKKKKSSLKDLIEIWAKIAEDLND